MEIARCREGNSVSQRKYTLDLLAKTGMLGCRPVDTPIEFNVKLETSGYRHRQSVQVAPYEDHMETLRKCTSKYCTFVWGNLVLEKVLSDLCQDYEVPMNLFSDNKAAISIANNLIQHDRTKNVEIEKHFIKEKLDNGSIYIPYIPSSQHIVDILRKGLLRQSFNLFVSKLGL
ncbi:putative mitochondrial protein [Cucumis melo var. makuwa]|uniref:Mitochondrial protein n=1 Tax=Cucumis melo var. makuwa TaxID=1194695 RepID=A0A5A7T3C8_CUCMM|nr:putative mitochondrial protein [Cucumis melo var. makuwa]TYK24186.1 putative mitochondrial protein [Cucumis melo var. makuwa]